MTGILWIKLEMVAIGNHTNPVMSRPPEDLKRITHGYGRHHSIVARGESYPRRTVSLQSPGKQ